VSQLVAHSLLNENAGSKSSTECSILKMIIRLNSKFWLFIKICIDSWNQTRYNKCNKISVVQYRRRVCGMESFFQICYGTTEKLGRKLQDEELAFLQWMYERYTNEQLETEVKQKEQYNLTMNS